MISNLKNWWKSGGQWVWLSAGAISVSLIMVFGLLLLIASRGLGYFWPADLVEFDYKDKNGAIVRLIGEISSSEQVSTLRLQSAGVDITTDQDYVTRYLLKAGNRDVTGMDFLAVVEPNILKQRYPKDLIAMERREWGNFYGYLQSIKGNGKVIATDAAARQELDNHVHRALQLHEKIQRIEKQDIGAINYALERLRLKQRGLELTNELTPEKLRNLEKERDKLDNQYKTLRQELSGLYQQINRDSLTAEVADGQSVEIPLSKVVRIYQPNAMSIAKKLSHYFMKLWEFVSDEPREANTEGGIFPAIFGTVMMVLIMSIMVTPFGVVAAVYLREYAKQGPLTRTIRIAVNNLAGVPAIVYGVFGLGFFVYFLGGNIDRLFFPESAPAPTFGTPGILWSSLTLAILTLPVVIIATEEGLTRIPRAIREGSLALGATKAETLWRIILPMASPALMTGMILAVARAAGEVAPLMLVGVVKLAPSLPMDGNFPYLHMDRKFMHLGFHIYDVGFQSPNVEAARPLVYATAILLVIVIVTLNLTAIAIRNRLREKYRTMEN